MQLRERIRRFEKHFIWSLCQEPIITRIIHYRKGKEVTIRRQKTSGTEMLVEMLSNIRRCVREKETPHHTRFFDGATSWLKSSGVSNREIWLQKWFRPSRTKTIEKDQSTRQRPPTRSAKSEELVARGRTGREN